MSSLFRPAAAVLAVGALFAAPAFPACTYPKDPGALPDGTKATLEEMLAAQKVVKQYNADMDDYMKCIDGETPKASDITPDMNDAQKKQIQKQMEAGVKKHNAAVADEEALAARFNEQLKAFKAKQPPKT